MQFLEVNFEGYVIFICCGAYSRTALVKSVSASAIAIKEVCKGNSD